MKTFLTMLALVSLCFSQQGHANKRQHPDAKQTKQIKTAKKASSAKNKAKQTKKVKRSRPAIGKARQQRLAKKRRKQTNLLHPVILRLAYTPSYRTLSKNLRDADLPMKRLMPLSAGLEGEVAFSQWASLAVGGSFTYRDKINETDDPSSDEGTLMSHSFYDTIARAYLYGNVLNYFKIGAGGELAFRGVIMNAERTEDGKKQELKSDMTWKRAAATIALRRDFFLPRVGFGIGFNVSLSLGDMIDLGLTGKSYVDGKLEESHKASKKEIDDLKESDLEGVEEGLYAIVLMPMIYFVF
ncbi:MAG: hypothetical protein OYH77_04470 [Pseudomonadota bacterium]|nr:hypothetical protein [Pseudomonadota bacterium]